MSTFTWTERSIFEFFLIECESFQIKSKYKCDCLKTVFPDLLNWLSFFFFLVPIREKSQTNLQNLAVTGKSRKVLCWNCKKNFPILIKRWVLMYRYLISVCCLYYKTDSLWGQPREKLRVICIFLIIFSYISFNSLSIL